MEQITIRRDTQTVDEHVEHHEGGGFAEIYQLVANEFNHVHYKSGCSLAPGIDAVSHYIEHGWLQGLDPTLDFCTEFYLARSPDVRALGLNPYYHYLKWGRLEGRAPNARAAASEPAPFGIDQSVVDVVGSEFDRDFYFISHPELVVNNIDPVLHYISFGAYAGFDPTPNFSSAYYLENNTDVVEYDVNPFFHYLRWGRLEGRAPNADAARQPANLSHAARLIQQEFDAVFYMQRYIDEISPSVNALLHYLNFGWRLGFDPSAEFCTNFYLKQVPELKDTGENPLHHYIRFGRSAGAVPKAPELLAAFFLDVDESDDKSDDDGDDDIGDAEYDDKKVGCNALSNAIEPFFDAEFYRKVHSDLRYYDKSLLLHYLEFGWREGRNPAPWFSADFYIRQYPLCTSLGISPLLHWVVWGRDRGFSTFSSSGSGVGVAFQADADLVKDNDLRALIAHPAQPIEIVGRTPNPRRLSVAFVIPDFEVGGGGHMTIFRVARYLEFFGHECSFWVYGARPDRSDEEREEILLSAYQTVRARVISIHGPKVFYDVDALVATSWDSAFIVNASSVEGQKFYFVQDYEPLFYPMGARALAALQTYEFDLACICASPWLARVLAQKHGRWTRKFWLAADERYRVSEASRPNNAVLRIAFYARNFTDRRAVELGLLALQLAAQRGCKFHVDFFGSQTRYDAAPFPATSWGVLQADALSELYSNADIGICFSATNYSLVPQEMMACGLPVIELDAEGTRETFPDGVVRLARATPQAIADAIGALIDDHSAREELGRRGRSWVESLSWESSARMVEAAMLERLGLPPVVAETDGTVKAIGQTGAVRASVIIPTYNGGEVFKRVLAQVQAQRTPWPFDVLVIDSQSSDGTWEASRDAGGIVRAHQIPKAEFQHGRTRNLAIAMTSGEYVAVITQDALPSDEFWLYNLVTMLERFPTAAGAFGRHVAWPDASPYVKRDIQNHFQSEVTRPLLVTKYLNIDEWRAGNRAFRQRLHFYSDNNSCLRRSVWTRIPYPEVDYGEDQLWALRILEAGYGRVYAPFAIVFHSHVYDGDEMFNRARIESDFFARYFKYDLAPTNIGQELELMNVSDLQWGAQNNIQADFIAAQLRRNARKLEGLTLGSMVLYGV